MIYKVILQIYSHFMLYRRYLPPSHIMQRLNACEKQSPSLYTFLTIRYLKRNRLCVRVCVCVREREINPRGEVVENWYFFWNVHSWNYYIQFFHNFLKILVLLHIYTPLMFTGNFCKKKILKKTIKIKRVEIFVIRKCYLIEYFKRDRNQHINPQMACLDRNFADNSNLLFFYWPITYSRSYKSLKII